MEYTLDFTTTYGSTTNWSYVSHSGNPQPSWSGGDPDLYIYFFKPTQNTLVLKMDVTNGCGTTSYDFGFKAIDCDGFRTTATKTSFKISPNPASNVINISSIETLEASKSKLISEVIISDFTNQIVKRQRFDNTKSAQLFIGSLKAGTYFVTVTSGDYRETQKIFKQ